MSQHSFYIDNQAGAAFRAALNAALEALVTLSAGEVAPATTYPFQLWADTGAGQLKQRNAANDDWITLGALGAAYLGLLPAVPVAGNYLRLAGPNVPPEQRTPQELADELSPLLSGLVPRGHIAGLRVGADPNNDVDIAPGECADSTATYWMRLESTLTKRLDAAWAEGDGEGGLDAGSKAANTWYAVHLIRSDGGTIDVLFSTSRTAPVLPSGYTAFRRIGWVRTDASGNIMGMTQVGDRVLWHAPIKEFDGSFGTTSALLTVTVPPGEKYVGLFISSHAAATGTAHLLSDPDLPDLAAEPKGLSTVAGASANAARDFGAPSQVTTNVSSQIRYRASAEVPGQITCMGYIDRRGRE